MTLDANLVVWTSMSWGRPFRLVSHFLNCSSLETTPIQIECGPNFSTVLTGSGDVLAWWPDMGAFKNRDWEAIVKMHRGVSGKTIVPDDNLSIPCHTWEIDMDPVRLPTLPDLPDLPATGLPDEERKKETKLIKIAACHNCLVGLTNKGHVLKLDGFLDEDSVRIWHYLPSYSEIDRVKRHPAFRMTTQEIPPQVELPSDTMLITHVSASDRSFFAYSSSMVLKGESKTTTEVLPIVIPALQNISTISVVCGNDHFSALTSSGKLLTWGRGREEALGLGDTNKLLVGSPGECAEEEQVQTQVYGFREVTVPSEVKFDQGLDAEGGAKMYCFAVAASGCYTAALVVDLEDEVARDGVPPGLESRTVTKDG